MSMLLRPQLIEGWKPKTNVIDQLSKHNRQSTARFAGERSDRQWMLKAYTMEKSYLTDLICPKGGPNFLFAKATSDESTLGIEGKSTLNFKSHEIILGKQHRASYKSKTENSISLPLHLLQMDLFGPTFVKSLMKKMYYVVVTDDYSRFTWVFFLATKDETSGILKSFMTGIENLVDHKVKIIRCDNGTKFKNKEINQFYEMKGILRQFSVARNPQQNEVAERRNRTLIEAARTMLADSKLPTTFSAKAVSTTCYVQNRVLVVKPYNNTPYELFHGRTPTLSFMRPFRCSVTILNTIDHLGKFNGKADEGFFVGYSLNSKAFRVFNSRTRIMEENLHIRFRENTHNVVGSGPDWLFDIHALTRTMNYKPIVAGTQSNGFAGTKASDNVGQARKEIEAGKDYILLPLWTTDLLFSKDPKSSQDDGSKPSDDDGKKVDDDLREESKSNDQEMNDDVNNTNNVNAASTNEVNATGEDISIELQDDPNMPALEDISVNDFSSDDEDVGVEADLNNLDTTIQVSPILTTRIHTDHPLDQVIRDLQSATQTKKMIKNLEEHGNKNDDRGIVIRNKARLVAQGHTQEEGIDYDEFFTPIIEEEVYVCQPPRFEDSDFPDKVYKVEKALYILHQAPTAWFETLSTYLLENRFQRGKIDKTLFIKRLKGDILMVQVYVDDIIFGLTKELLKQKKDDIFISQDKYVTEILKKFGFTDVKTTRTPMETQKPLLKDEDGEEVDVHMYRYQVNPKISHLHAVKRIFRYLKGQPRLGLWYLKDSPFDLVAYTDSDYAGCKKQTVVANSITKAEYVAALSCFYVSCIEQFWTAGVVKKINGETKIHALVDGKKLVVTKASTRRDLQQADEGGVNYDVDGGMWMVASAAGGGQPTTTVARVGRSGAREGGKEEGGDMGYEKISQKLMFYKAFFSPQWKFLIHTVLQSLSSKTTACNEFSSTMASAVICLATNQKFNFSKFIFEGMLRNLDNVTTKFLMYPRFVQLFVNQQMEGMPTHKRKYIAPCHTKKVFGNMKRVGKDFSGNVTPLFPTMVVQNQAQTPTITETSTPTTTTIPTSIPTTIIQPTPSQPQKKHPRKHKRKATKVPQPSEPSHIADEAVYKDMEDRLVRAATTASSLEAEQDSGNINKTRSKATPNKHGSQGTRSGGGPRCQETMGVLLLKLGLREYLNFLMIYDSQEIESLEKKVKRLERSKKSRSHKLKRLYKVGLTTRIESSKEEDLGEDASKHGRISAIDADKDITMVIPFVDEQDVEMSEKEEDVALNAAKDGLNANDEVTVEEITLAQALQKMKSTTPKAKGAVIQEREQGISIKEQTRQHVQGKGKEKMIEPKRPLKKKDQIRLDEKTALRLQAQFDEEERFAKEEAQKIEKANIALIEEWDNIQAKIDTDYQLAERLQAEEQEELSVKEKTKLLKQLLDTRRKHFAEKRIEEKRNKPPTKAQQRKIMCNYLKNMEGYLKFKDFDVIQKIFDKAFKRVNTFDDYTTELLEELMQIIPDEEEVAIDAIPLAVKSPKIVGWKIYKKGKKSYYQIIRADGKSQMYMIFSHMLKSFDREDLEDLYKLVKAKYGSNKPVEDLDLLLWGDLVHSVILQSAQIYMLVEKRYPLTPPTLTQMLEKKFIIDYESEMAYQLIKSIVKLLEK
ncbi:putative ribonuclease H-like domain-containing protein [Tanacetum coccineum]